MKKLMKIIQIHTEKNLESTVWVFEPVLGQDQEHVTDFYLPFP